MKNSGWVALGMAGALCGVFASGLALAEQDQDSLLPPGYDDPDPAPTALPTAVPTTLPTVAPVPVAPALNDRTPSPAPDEAAQEPLALPPVSQLSDEELRDIPELEELEQLSTDELDELFGLKPKFDIPPAARRSLRQVGVIAPAEGGLGVNNLSNQPAGLVRAVLKGVDTALVSRWGHILTRRALASRLEAPDGMDPVEFAALRAGALNRMGEYAVTRALVQDVDTGNWSEPLAQEALTAFIAQSDLVGVCPFVRLRGVPEAPQDSANGDGLEADETDQRAAQWTMMSAICSAYAGEGALANSQLDSALNREIAPAIDVLLARRFAGAAGRGRRAVSIEWDEVTQVNPWRFSLAHAVGEPIPDALLEDLSPYYARAGANSSMVPLNRRAQFASQLAEEGIFSAKAMVDLYSDVYTTTAIGGVLGERARRLREAYIAPKVATRLSAMEALWEETENGDAYWAKVLTAYAAARVAPSSNSAKWSDDLIASMLSAGLDRDAMSWEPYVSQGTLGWALVTLADRDGGIVSLEALDVFADADSSRNARKTQFLIAGLAGLGRLDSTNKSAFEARLSIDLDRQTRWVRAIQRAGEVGNPTMVALLAGLGMQGTQWSQMTPLHLYHIVSALNAVGLKAEARMIAAEAVSRG